MLKGTRTRVLLISDRERERQKHRRETETLVGRLPHAPTQGSNPQPFGMQDDAPTACHMIFNEDMLVLASEQYTKKQGPGQGTRSCPAGSWLRTGLTSLLCPDSGASKGAGA